MSDLSEIVFSCDSWEEMYRTFERIKEPLSVDARKRINDAVGEFAVQWGHEKAWQRMNGRNIQSILDEYDAMPKRKPVASGELNGLKFRLYDPPESSPDDAS